MEDVVQGKMKKKFAAAYALKAQEQEELSIPRKKITKLKNEMEVIANKYKPQHVKKEKFMDDYLEDHLIKPIKINIKLEDVKLIKKHRKLDCEHQPVCLAIASYRGYKSYSCTECKLHKKKGDDDESNS